MGERPGGAGEAGARAGERAASAGEETYGDEGLRRGVFCVWGRGDGERDRPRCWCSLRVAFRK